jgi:hypothetical protein
MRPLAMVSWVACTGDIPALLPTIKIRLNTLIDSCNNLLGFNVSCQFATRIMIEKKILRLTFSFFFFCRATNQSWKNGAERVSIIA